MGSLPPRRFRRGGVFAVGAFPTTLKRLESCFGSRYVAAIRKRSGVSVRGLQNGNEKLAARWSRARERGACNAQPSTQRLVATRLPSGREAEIAFARALIAFIQGAPTMCARSLHKALPQIPEQRIRYAQLRAWVYGLNEQFERQATHLLHALSLAQKKKSTAGYSRLLPNRSRLWCVKSSSANSGCTRNRCSSKFTWPAEQTTARFYTQRALAWRKALRGDWIPAMRLLDGAFALLLMLCVAASFSLTALASAWRSANPFLLVLVQRQRFRVLFRNRMGLRRRETRPTGVFAAHGCSYATSRTERRVRFVQPREASIFRRLSAVSYGRRLEAFKSFALSHLTEGEEALSTRRARTRCSKK